MLAYAYTFFQNIQYEYGDSPLTSIKNISSAAKTLFLRMPEISYTSNISAKTAE